MLSAILWDSSSARKKITQQMGMILGSVYFNQIKKIKIILNCRINLFIETFEKILYYP